MKLADDSELGVSVANGAVFQSRLSAARPTTLTPSTSLQQADQRGAVVEWSFERVAGLARIVLGAPVAFVEVVDRLGVGVPAGLRDVVGEALCRRVIDAGTTLTIDDARPEAGGAGRLVAWAGSSVRGPTGRVVGVLCVADHVPRRWTDGEIGILQQLAEVASDQFALGRALDESRKHGAERAALARTLQESLLPPWLPRIPGLQVAARYVAGGSEVDVLGDFYDVFPSLRGSWGIVVGDVCGKGVPAAKSTALARYTLRAEAYRQTRPSVILACLNRALLDWPTADPRFLTAVYATVRPTAAGASVQACSAGHPLALVRRADGRVHTIGQPGTLLGPLPEPVLHDCRTQLHAGDSLILFTDGVTEARHHQDRSLFGDDRLHAMIAATRDMPAADLAETIQQAVRAFGGTPASDDTVVLVLKATP